MGSRGPADPVDPRDDHQVVTCRSPQLYAIVTVALNTGMRRGEILGLTWERVDFARGVVLLEVTKSGRRREDPHESGCVRRPGPSGAA